MTAGLGAMGESNIEDGDGEDHAQRSVDHAIQTRKLSAADALEKADQAKVANGAREQRQCKRKGQPSDPWVRGWRADEPGRCGDKQCACGEADGHHQGANRRRHEGGPAGNFGNRHKLSAPAAKCPVEMD